MSLKSNLLVLSLLTSTSLFAQQGTAKIEACAGSTTEAVCVGKILNKKMNRILKKLSSGNSNGNSLGIVAVDLKFTDNNDCTGAKSTGAVLASNLEEIKTQCEKVASGYSGFENIDGIIINGTCFDIESSAGYQMDNLATLCAAKIVSAN